MYMNFKTFKKIPICAQNLINIDKTLYGFLQQKRSKNPHQVNEKKKKNKPKRTQVYFTILS